MCNGDVHVCTCTCMYMYVHVCTYVCIWNMSSTKQLPTNKQQQIKISKTRRINADHAEDVTDISRWRGT